MNKYLLKRKLTSDILSNAFDAADRFRSSSRSAGDVLVDGCFVYSKIQFREKYTSKDITEMRSAGRIQYTTIDVPETIQIKLLVQDPSFQLRFILELPDQYTEQDIDMLYILAKNIVSQLIELDQKARDHVGAVHDGFNYEPRLSRVRINADEVELHYHSTTCNTEWGVFFSIEENFASWNVVDWG